MEVVKFGALAALAGLVASIIGDTATVILGLGVIGGGLGWLWRRILRPNAQLYKLLEGLPDWMTDTTERLERGDEKFDALHGRLDVLETRTGATVEAVTAVTRDLDIHHRGESDRPAA